MAISKYVYDTVHPIAEQFGVPDYVWMSIAEMESNGNPLMHYSTVGKKDLPAGTRAEDSYGLFSVDVIAGQGATPEYKNNPKRLYNLSENSRVAMPHIANAYQKAKDELGMNDSPDLAGWVASHSGHPTNTGNMSNPTVSKAVNRVKQYATKFYNQFGAGEMSEVGTIEGAKDWNEFEQTDTNPSDVPTDFNNPSAIDLGMLGTITKIVLYLLLGVLIIVSIVNIFNVPVSPAGAVKGAVKSAVKNE